MAIAPQEKNIEIVEVGKLREGLAWAMTHGGKWTHIKPDGSLAHGKLFCWAGSFRGGKAKVMKNGRYFYIDPSGKEVDAP